MNKTIHYNNLMEILGVTAASEELELSKGRIIQLINQGKLRAHKVGREWAILRSDLEVFKSFKRNPGKEIEKPDNELQKIEIAAPSDVIGFALAKSAETGMTLDRYIEMLLREQMI
jgi:excisionase family DNA binding protein